MKVSFPTISIPPIGSFPKQYATERNPSLMTIKSPKRFNSGELLASARVGKRGNLRNIDEENRLRLAVLEELHCELFADDWAALPVRDRKTQGAFVLPLRLVLMIVTPRVRRQISTVIGVDHLAHAKIVSAHRCCHARS